MNRQDFLKKGLQTTGALIATSGIAKAIQNSATTITESEQLVDNNTGFNHLPNTNSKIMNNTVLHKAATRGYANHGWLKSNHTFSFANYYNPERMHFGVLRVLNDDFIDGGMGFGTHPHDNMEIITIPLSGSLAHKDSMGNGTTIKSGDIQVMSAGTGIQHSEFNADAKDPVTLLQIWVIPNKRSVTPRYDQITLNKSDEHNQLNQILSPNANDNGVWIHQDAWFHLGTFDQNKTFNYDLRKKGNGVYAFVIEGSFEINNQSLSTRDALGIWDVSDLNIKSTAANSRILIMDVPMTI
jgi:redox-sensitive bicupin YhaK (pirin superfamily)